MRPGSSHRTTELEARGINNAQKEAIASVVQSVQVDDDNSVESRLTQETYVQQQEQRIL